MNLNEAQKQAVCHVQGPMMVLAGPGSGKTTVIVNRIRYLTEKAGIDPGQILVITFTRAAAEEMKSRYEKAAGKEGGICGVTFGTFHSIFFAILRQTCHYQASDILQEGERLQILKGILQQAGLGRMTEKEQLAQIAGEISLLKNEGQDPASFAARTLPQADFQKLLQAYRQELLRRHRLDFDDMLEQCRAYFLRDPQLLKTWQDRFRYILIDEFQDINRIQYEVIRMLAAPRNNLFIVGDDDQSVYGFRGSRPEIMLNFPKTYPDCRQVLLGVNYRSSAVIVEAASGLIGYNKTRFPKELTAFHQGGAPIRFLECPNRLEESRRITEEIRDYLAAGTDPSRIAILFRTNEVAGMLAESLRAYNIPVSGKEGSVRLYDHWICKDLIAYLELARGKLLRRHLLRVMNRPNRYFDREALQRAAISWEEVRDYYAEKDWMRERVEGLQTDLARLAQLPPDRAISMIRTEMGYDSFLKAYAAEKQLKAEELLALADSLEDSAASCQTAEDWYDRMEAADSCGKESKPEKGSEEKKGVALMTMHGSKGLEFDIVYMPQANEKITPHHKAVRPEEIEEERRMFYVAMTRAKSRLTISYVRERAGKRESPSRFVREILEKRNL